MPQLRRAADNTVLLPRLEIATTFWKRFIGLQFRRSLNDGEGLFLHPCSSLHSCFVRFPIDVVMLDGNNHVLAVRRNLRPWRALLCVRGTRAVIETRLNALNLDLGEKLLIDGQRSGS